VLIGDEKDGECVACGGTHPSSAGQDRACAGAGRRGPAAARCA
jgi:hypothetical protein